MRILRSVSPTPEQLPILSENKPGFLLIKGAAGSGKTTTALLRLKQLCASWLARRGRLGLTRPVRVLVLTYNRTLEGYIRELADEQVPSDPHLDLEVRTFGKWALELVGPVDILDPVDQRRILRRLCHPLGLDTDFLVDEVEYVLGRFTIDRLDDYLKARRVGRGTSPRMDVAMRSRLLLEVVEPYAKEKAAIGALDWNDIAIAAARAIDDPWDVVVVDEAQDFSANQVRAITSHLADPFSATFVMDAVQRIYPRFFTWKEVGISLTNVHTLRANHRNSSEIAAFARPLVEDLPLEDDGALPDFASTIRSGPLPEVVTGAYSEQISYMLQILGEIDLSMESAAFLQPRGGKWFSYLKGRLNAAGIDWVQLTRASTWPADSDAVAICTLHSAKGLEFDHVFIPGLNQEVTPHGAEDGDAQFQGLRRLLAMGVGRARSRLVLGYKPAEASSLVGLFRAGTFKQVPR